MALITISGYPSSGKSTRAAQIKDYLEKQLALPEYEGPRLHVEVLSDDVLNLNRTVYNGTRFAPCARTFSLILVALKNPDPRNLLEGLFLHPCNGKWPQTRFSSSII